MWIEGVEENDLPDWIGERLVVGEEPGTGNYLLMPTAGDHVGHIFTFDHDGFEFTEEASDILEFVSKLLVPDNCKVVEMASHMRFCDFELEPAIQWWIRDFRDNRGHHVTTSA